jgi:ribosomal protein S18 acetylase RimI-like enzyme
LLGTRIRRATPGDQPALVKLYRQAWHAAYDPVDGPAWVDSMSDHLLAGDRPLMFALQQHDVSLVATRFGRIVGAVRAHRLHDGAFLSGFYLRPDRKRQGIGSMLFWALVAELPPDETIMLNVRPTSAGARSFYARLGFEEVGTGTEDLGGGHLIDVVKLRWLRRERPVAAP